IVLSLLLGVAYRLFALVGEGVAKVLLVRVPERFACRVGIPIRIVVRWQVASRAVFFRAFPARSLIGRAGFSVLWCSCHGGLLSVEWLFWKPLMAERVPNRGRSTRLRSLCRGSAASSCAAPLAGRPAPPAPAAS